MSLNWNVSNIENSKEVCWIDDPIKGMKSEGRVMNPVTEGLIFATMAVDIGHITVENASDFYARVSQFTQMYGSFVTKFEDGKAVPYFFTPQDVHNHIGLTTNVFTVTRAKWLTRMKEQWKRELGDGDWRFERDLAKSEVK